MIESDTFILPRLSLLHVLVSCFQSNFETQSDKSVTNYSCRNYAEFCFFYWSLLGKVKKLSELPAIEEWSEYVGQPLSTWANVSYIDCLRSEPIVTKALDGCCDAVKRSFLWECHGFLMEFLKVLNASACATSRLSSSLSCFSSDMLLMGEEAYTVSLFRDLVSCLQTCGRLSSVEAEGATNEFKSLLVDLRRRNWQVISTIKDSFRFLWQSGLLGCRLHLSKVVGIVSVGVVPRVIQYPEVEISLSGAAIPEKVLLSSIRAVQSYISDSGSVSGELLTKDCFDELKANLQSGHIFMSDVTFAPWRCLCVHSRQDMNRNLRDSFNDYYMGQVAEWRRRAGLCVLSVTSPTSKLPTVKDVETWSGAVSSVLQLTSAAAPVSSGAVQPAKTVASVSGSSDVAQRLKEKKAIDKARLVHADQARRILRGRASACPGSDGPGFDDELHLR